jgi:hypothetical protein
MTLKVHEPPRRIAKADQPRDDDLVVADARRPAQILRLGVDEPLNQ